MTVISEIARAKVNLALRVLGRRADGYHELASLVAFASIGDIVAIDFDKPPSVRTDGSFANAIDGPNLISKALELLAAAGPALRLGAVTLSKHLPVAAGLGGGSADAAAVLRLVRSHNVELAPSLDWDALALRLGADVPVCLAGRTCVMRGIGERLGACSMPPMPAVLVNPQVLVPGDKTRRVFQALAAGPVDRTRELRIADELDWDSLLALMREVGNDLEGPAVEVMPAIANVKTTLARQAGCLHAQLSGAGPTCFGLFASEADAHAAARHVSATKPGWWVAATWLASAAPCAVATS